MRQTAQLQISQPDIRGSCLTERLRAFAGRDAGGADETDGLRSVLRRIDETILPRVLTVATEAGDELCLLVSNRRLMRIERAGESLTSADAPSDPAEAARLFAARLAPVLRSTQGVRFSVERYHADALFWDVGCGAGRLAATMAVAPPLPANTSGPSDFDACLRERALAWAELSATGSVVSREATTQTDAILTLLVDHVTGSGSASSVVAANTTECSFVPLADDLDALVAQVQGRRVLAIVPSPMRDELTRIWHKSTGALSTQ